MGIIDRASVGLGGHMRVVTHDILYNALCGLEPNAAARPAPEPLQREEEA